jgi:protein gp37
MEEMGMVNLKGIDWVIVGAETFNKNRVRPGDWWIYQLYNQASYQGCAVFIKIASRLIPPFSKGGYSR